MDLRRFFFRQRGYTPIPLIAAALALSKTSRLSWFTGVLLMLIGEGIRLWGTAYKGRSGRITTDVSGDRLVTQGPFAHVRNPLYCGNFLLWSGVLVASWAWMPWMALVLLFFFFFQYNRIVDLEEEYLSKKFGSSYSAYRKAVARWIPRFSGYKGPEKYDPDWKQALRSERDTFLAILAVLILVFLRWRLR